MKFSKVGRLVLYGISAFLTAHPFPSTNISKVPTVDQTLLWVLSMYQLKKKNDKVVPIMELKIELMEAENKAG